MVQLSIELTVADFQGELVGVLRIGDHEKRLVNLCDSKVGLKHCLSTYDYRGGKIPSEVIDAVMNQVEDSAFPDFSEAEEIAFDQFTSLTLYSAIPDFREIINDPIKRDAAYDAFKAEKNHVCCFPVEDNADELGIQTERSGVYFQTNPVEVCIFYSKIQAAAIYDRLQYPQMLIDIHNSILPDDSLESEKWYYGKHAEIIAFILWCNKAKKAFPNNSVE